MTKSTTVCIRPDDLLYRLVCTTPAADELTYLQKLVLAGLLLFVVPGGEVKLAKEDREHLTSGLSLSKQGMSNIVKDLITRGLLIKTKEGYQLTEQTIHLAEAPKKLLSEYTIKLVTNKQ